MSRTETCSPVGWTSPMEEDVHKLSEEEMDTAFGTAVSNNCVLLVRSLIEQGWYNPESTYFNKNEWTAVGIAVNHRSTDMLKMLLKHGGKASGAMNGIWGPLHVAAHVGNEDAVDILLEAGAPVNEAFPEGHMQTPLHVASTAGVVEKLLAAGADPRAQLSDEAKRWTPLHTATERVGRPGVLFPLLKHDRTLMFVEDSEGMTPAHLAARLNAGTPLIIMRCFGLIGDEKSQTTGVAVVSYGTPMTRGRNQKILRNTIRHNKNILRHLMVQNHAPHLLQYLVD